MRTPPYEPDQDVPCQTRTAEEWNTRPKWTEPREREGARRTAIATYYRDFFDREAVEGRLVRISEELARHGSLRFSADYPGELIPLIEETVAWEMLLCDYSPGPRDRIEFGMIEALPVAQLNLMFATGLTDTARISNPRIFIREDILASHAHGKDRVLAGFDTYAEEIRHSVEALWRNRIGYLTSGQQGMVNRGTLEVPRGWPVPDYCEGSFITQILGESIAHLMDFVRYRHESYGKVNDYNWDYFVDLVVRHASITLCQTDAHRPAQAVDAAIRNKLNRWTASRRFLLPTLARRLSQFLLLRVPERVEPVSESPLRSWQALHDLPFVVGGLFDRALTPQRLRSELNRAVSLLKQLRDELASEGLRMEDNGSYENTLKKLARISAGLGSGKAGQDGNDLLQVKQHVWHALRYAGRALNRGSALRAVVEEMEELEDLPSFYAALLGKIRAAARSAQVAAPDDDDGRRLLQDLFRRIRIEAAGQGLRLQKESTKNKEEEAGSSAPSSAISYP